MSSSSPVSAPKLKVEGQRVLLEQSLCAIRKRHECMSRYLKFLVSFLALYWFLDAILVWNLSEFRLVLAVMWGF
jgi:hypothetical protein